MALYTEPRKFNGTKIVDTQLCTATQPEEVVDYCKCVDMI